MEKDKNLKILVLLADIIVLTVSIVGYYFLLQCICPQNLGNVVLPSFWAIIVFSFLISFAFNPSVTQHRMVTSEQVIQRSLLTSVICFFLATLFIIIARPLEFFPRFFMYTFFVVFTVLLIMERMCIRYFLRRMRSSNHNLRYALFLGYSSQAEKIYDMLTEPYNGFKVVGLFADDDIIPKDSNLKSLRLGGGPDVWKWLGSHAEITDVFVFFSLDYQQKINLLSKYCDNHLIRMFYVPEINVLNNNYQFERIGSSILITRRSEPLQNPANRFVKRAFDLIVSSLFMLLIFPWIYCIVAIIIKIQSPGPVFFKQARTGLDGKIFDCYKFRSMKVNKDADRIQATKDDPRKYPFGNLMRKTNIDELPQLINVWKGDMSIVGPRPHMLKHTEEYSHIINRFMVRHFAKPGITGLAQVSGYRGEIQNLDQLEGRVKKDIEYIENWTFLLDMKIIVKTGLNMIHGEKNAY